MRRNTVPRRFATVRLCNCNGASSIIACRRSIRYSAVRNSAFFFFADTFTWLPVLHPAWRRNCTHLSWPASTQFVHAYCFWKEKANLRENWLDSLDSLEGGLAVAAFPRRPLETARGNGSEDKIRKSSENEREQAQPATQSCFWQQFVVLFLVIRNS
jgi:hypothetical protein